MLGRLYRFAAVASTAVAALAPGALGAPPARANINVDDPGFPLQWGLEAIGAPDAWSRATGMGITIAIVDSGIDLQHADLQDKLVGNVSCVGSEGDPDACTGSGQDDDGHGTHVAGIAAAITGNGLGVAGVAPDAKLLAVKALSHECVLLDQCSASGAASDVSAAIRWAADHGAQVINLSLGNTTQAVFGPSFADAIQYAWGKGVIPVVAAGNDFILSPGFSTEPALVVAAVDSSKRKATYSNGVGSAQWALSAPGGEAGDDETTCATGHVPVGVLSTYWKDPDTHEYACLAGTSMAAPHVAGAAALLRSMGFTPQETVDRLLATADDLGAPGRDTTFGAGLVNVARAIEVDADAGTTTLTTGPPAGGGDPATTTTAVAPATVPGGGGAGTPSTTAPGGDDPSFAAPGARVDLGVAQAAGAAGPGSAEQPATGLVGLAVLLIVVIGTLSAWVAFRGASWARRTP